MCEEWVSWGLRLCLGAGKCKQHDSERQCESLSQVRLFATPWTVALQAPLSMGLSRQEYWSEGFSKGFLEDREEGKSSLWTLVL